MFFREGFGQAKLPCYVDSVKTNLGESFKTKLHRRLQAIDTDVSSVAIGLPQRSPY